MPLPLAFAAALRGIIRRDAIQDMAIAATLEDRHPHDRRQAGPEALKKRGGELAAKAVRLLLGAEQYLRIRDSLYAEAQK